MNVSSFCLLVLLGFFGIASAGVVSNYPQWYDWYLSTSYIENWYWAGANSFFDFTYSYVFQYWSTFTYSVYTFPVTYSYSTYWTTYVQSTFDTSYLNESSDAFSLIPSIVGLGMAVIALF